MCNVLNNSHYPYVASGLSGVLYTVLMHAVVRVGRLCFSHFFQNLSKPLDRSVAFVSVSLLWSVSLSLSLSSSPSLSLPLPLPLSLPAKFEPIVYGTIFLGHLVVSCAPAKRRVVHA